MVKGELRTPENAVAICDGLAAGKTLRGVSRDLQCDPSGILQWVRADSEFAQQYTRAREIGYMLLADEILDIADDAGKVKPDEDGSFTVPDVQFAKLQVDTRKWMVAKMLPKLFGDRQTISIEDLRRQVEQSIEGASDADIIALAAGNQGPSAG